MLLFTRERRLAAIERRIVIIEELQDRLLQSWVRTAREQVPDARRPVPSPGLKTPSDVRLTVHADMKFHKEVFDRLDGVSQQTGTGIDEMIQRIVYRALGFNSGEED